jgi:HEAT repeat protein
MALKDDSRIKDEMSYELDLADGQQLPSGDGAASSRSGGSAAPQSPQSPQASQSSQPAVASKPGDESSPSAQALRKPEVAVDPAMVNDLLADAERLDAERKKAIKRATKQVPGTPSGGDPEGEGPDDQKAFTEASETSNTALVKATYAAFGLSFVRSINLTGYYPADHPAILNVATKPFEDLCNLRRFSSEVSFITMAGHHGEEVMVDVMDEPLPFLKLLNSYMAETFALKFVNYLSRNNLVSFSIKTGMPQEEFKRFLALIVEQKTALEEGRDAAQVKFGALLLERKIFSVSAVSRDEILGSNRFLPWRVKIAITRLQKDLGVLPLYSSASEEELQKAKQMIVGDIIRPLRQPRFIRELLANCDLIRANVEELAEVDVESEIIACLHPTLVEDVTWEVVSVLEKAAWNAITQSDGEGERRIDLILRDILKKLALRLVAFANAKTFDMLEKLFRRRVLEFHELPDSLQRVVLTELRTNQFLETGSAIVEHFNSIADPQEYGKFLMNFEMILPELVKRRKIDEAIMLLRLLDEHQKATRFAEMASMVRYAMIGTATDENVELLMPLAAHPDREIRGKGIELLGYLGERGADGLFRVLAASEHVTVRRDVLKALEKMGQVAGPLLMERLSQPGFDWFVYRNIILLLDNLRLVKASEDIVRFIKFSQPRVREQVAQYLFNNLGKESEQHLVLLLDDPDWKVQRRVLLLLAEIGSMRGAFRRRLVDILRPEKELEAEDEPLVLSALSAVGSLGEFVTDDGVQASNVLMDLLYTKPARLIDRWRLKTSPTLEKIRSEILRTLVRIGDRDLLYRLKQKAEEMPQELKALALAAARELERRLTATTTTVINPGSKPPGGSVGGTTGSFRRN